MAIRVSLNQIGRTFARSTVALRDVSLTVEPGTTLAIVGPSGSGKSTLLRLVAGLDAPSTGTIQFDDSDIGRIPPWRRPLALLGQSPALFPNLSVDRNVALGLKNTPWSTAERRRRVEELATLLDLHAFRNRRIRELSGGEQQRVALARALAPQRPLLLLDEPFASLDTPLSQSLRDTVAHFQQTERFTVIHVTHNQADAFAGADHVAVLVGGHVVQHDSPETLYTRPATLTVAQFTSDPPLNLFAGSVNQIGGSPHLTLDDGKTSLPMTPPIAAPARLLLGVRPEHTRLARSGDKPSFPATAVATEFRGSVCYLHARRGTQTLRVRLDQTEPIQPGSDVVVTFDVSRLLTFDPDSGNAIRGRANDPARCS